MITNADFVHLHNHTEFSRFDGLARIDDLTLTAKLLGMKAVGITDHGNVGGWIKFHQSCKKKFKYRVPREFPIAQYSGKHFKVEKIEDSRGDVKELEISFENPIKPILGEEFYLSRDYMKGGKEGNPDGRKGNRHLLLIAKNMDGYQNLCALSQKSWTHGQYIDPRIDLNLLAEHSKGIICSSACLGSVINNNLLHGRYDQAKKVATILKDIFGADFYLSVMYHGIDAEGAVVPEIIRLGRELGIMVVAENDCFVAGTMITTADGVKPIENIRIGDLVLSDKNRFRRVEFVNESEVDSIFTVKTVAGTIALEATANHPVYCVQVTRSGTTQPTWKNIANLTNKDYLLVHKQISSHPRKTIQQLDLESQLGPSFNRYLRDGFYETKQGFGGRSGIVKVPKVLDVDDELLFILGRYVAEGSSNGNSNQVAFAAHKLEKKIQDRIATYFARFGITSYRPENGNDGKLVFSSVIWAKLLTGMCGIGAENKHLPSVGEPWTSKQLLQILRAYSEGDGHVTTDGRTFLCCSTSRQLAYEVSNFLSSAGIFAAPTLRPPSKNHKNPNAHPEKWLPLYVITITKEETDRLWRGCSVNQKRKSLVDVGEYYGVKVKSVTTRKVNEIVYNIQVEEDSTYVANSYVVHNCHYCRKEQARSQEILMAMSTSRCIKDPKRIHFPYGEFYVKNAQEMSKIFGHYPEIITNTMSIADRVEDYLKMGGMRLPKFDIEEARKDAVLLKFETPKSDHDKLIKQLDEILSAMPENPADEDKTFEKAYAFMVELVEKGVLKLKWQGSKDHIEAIKTELTDVRVAWESNQMDFATYFLIVWDIINFARKEGILTGCGRGSGYASLVLRALGITYGPDPIKHGLLWERFLGFDGKFYLNDRDLGIGETDDDFVSAEVAELSGDDIFDERATEDDMGGVDRY
jgi:intein/homing endonuclease